MAVLVAPAAVAVDVVLVAVVAALSGFPPEEQ